MHQKQRATWFLKLVMVVYRKEATAVASTGGGPASTLGLHGCHGDPSRPAWIKIRTICHTLACCYLSHKLQSIAPGWMYGMDVTLCGDILEAPPRSFVRQKRHFPRHKHASAYPTKKCHPTNKSSTWRYFWKYVFNRADTSFPITIQKNDISPFPGTFDNVYRESFKYWDEICNKKL